MIISNLNHVEVVSEITEVVGGTTRVVAAAGSISSAKGKYSNANTVAFAAANQGSTGGVAFSAGSASGKYSALSGSAALVAIF